MERTPGGSPLRIAAVVLANLIFALILTEIGVRVFAIGPEVHVVYREIFQPSENPILAYELRPNSSYRLTAVNGAGYRGLERSTERTSGMRRIAAIGDSATFGFRCPEEGTWPRRLETRLEAAGDRVEVLNFGISGYNISQVAERLRVLGLRYQPDAVIYGFLLNDVEDFSMQAEALRTLEQERGNSLGRWLGVLRLYRLFHVLVVGAPQDPEALNMPPIVRARNRGISAADYYTALYDQPGSQRRLFEGMAALAGLIGDREGLVLIFPVFDRQEGSPLRLPELHARVASQARAHGLSVLDLDAAYRAASERGEEIFVDALHPSPQGQDLAARIAHEWIVDRGWMDRAPTPSLSR